MKFFLSTIMDKQLFATNMQKNNIFEKYISPQKADSPPPWNNVDVRK